MNQIPSEIVEDGINASGCGAAGSYRYAISKKHRPNLIRAVYEDQKRFRAKRHSDRLRVFAATHISQINSQKQNRPRYVVPEF
jgi:hypothetical protein